MLSPPLVNASATDVLLGWPRSIPLDGMELCRQVPKLGYVATVPGSILKFTVDTSSTTQTGAAEPHTVVTLSHLKSYEGMGQAGAAAAPKWPRQPTSEGLQCTESVVTSRIVAHFQSPS